VSNPYPLSIYEIQAGRLPGWANEPILLTIPAGSVTGVLEDFPVMVKLSGSSGKTAADVSKVFTALGTDANRKRICITTGDGLTSCYVEIKEWSTATQTAFLWVRVPRVDPGLDTRLYLYYDPLHVEMTEYVGDTGEVAAQAVWGADYQAVWHMSLVNGQVLDSTANQNHLTVYGATAAPGDTGTCLMFDGGDDYCVPVAVVNMGYDEITFISHIHPISTGSYQSVCMASAGGGRMGWGASLLSPTRVKVEIYGAAGGRQTHNDGPVSAQYSVRFGRTGIDIFTDEGSQSIEIGEPGNTVADRGMKLGGLPGSTGWPYYGTMSEIQILRSTVARSPAWIAATNAALRDDLIVYSDPSAPLTLAGYADAYDYLSWTRRYRRPGAWKAQINRYLPAAKEFIPGRLVHFKRNGEDRLGLIETRQISVDQSGRPSEQWTVAGREIIGILGDRLCLAGVGTGTGYDEQTGAAETVMRHYVDVNAVQPADLARIVPFLALSPTDDGRGDTTAQKARFDVLGDLLESICAASGLGYRGRWSWDDRRLYFEVLEGTDRSGSVYLSPALGNCTIRGYNESTGLAPSVAVVAGQGEAAARVVADVGADIGFARRETYIDARDCATEAELLQRGTEKLAEDGDTTTLEVEYIQTAMYRYGEDFDLGDVVHVEYPDIASMDARIVEITEEYAREGEKLTLTLGTEWPDLVSVLRAQRKDNVEKRA